MEIRESRSEDILALEALYPAAFPDEDLVPIVRELVSGPWPILSLVAIADTTTVGHILFTSCTVAQHSGHVALLAPLAVTPEMQRQGVGRTLVTEGLERLRRDGVERVYVLGDPAYYQRFGFSAESNVAPPYPLPDEWRGAWQSLELVDRGSMIQGSLLVPEPWRRPALWAP